MGSLRPELFASGLLLNLIFFSASSVRLCVKISSLPLYFVTSLLHSLFVFSRSRQRKLASEEELYDVALRALMRRAHSVQEMKQKLTRRADNELLVRVVLARLKENGQLDDERYAQQFTRNRTQSRKQGKFRIARDLRARGVADNQINAAIEDAAAMTDAVAMVRQRI